MAGNIRTPLPWNGSSHKLAKKIIRLMGLEPELTHYVEPFYGGGSVLFAKDPDGTSEVVNDINRELTNFWEVIRNPITFDSFYRRIDAMPYSEESYNCPVSKYDDTPVGEAMRFFVRFCQCRPNSAPEFHTPIPSDYMTEGMGSKAHRWIETVNGLPEAHERLLRVAIINRDAIDVIIQQDSPITLFYCDPPKLHLTPTRSTYTYGSSYEFHMKLLRTLETIKGRFVLSGNKCDLYDAFADRNFWGRVDFEIPVGSDTTEIIEECVYLNF